MAPLNHQCFCPDLDIRCIHSCPIFSPLHTLLISLEQLHLKPAEKVRKREIQLHISKTNHDAGRISHACVVAVRFGLNLLHTDALPWAFRERHEPFLQFHALVAEPALRDELMWQGEEGWVLVDCDEGAYDGCLTKL